MARHLFLLTTNLGAATQHLTYQFRNRQTNHLTILEGQPHNYKYLFRNRLLTYNFHYSLHLTTSNLNASLK